MTQSISLWFGFQNGKIKGGKSGGSALFLLPSNIEDEGAENA